MITIKTDGTTVRIGENRGQLNINSVVINGEPINLDEPPIDLEVGNGNVVISGTDAPIHIQMGGKKRPTAEPTAEPSATESGPINPIKGGGWLSYAIAIYVILFFVFAGIALFVVSNISWAWALLILGIVAAFFVYVAIDFARPSQ